MQLCPDAVPSLLHLFDVAIAPPLLYYVYIPILVVCLFLGVFIFKSDKYSVASTYFFLINLAFASYIILSIIQWIAVHVEIVYLAWQVYLLSEICIFIFTVLFSYAYLYKVQLIPKVLAYAALIAVGFFSVVTPTQLNVYAFDIANCEGVVGSIGPFAYIFELFCIGLILAMFLYRFKSVKSSNNNVAQVVFFGVGMTFFLSVFWMSNYFGEMTLTYEINLIGPLGMVIFIGMMSYMLVKFKAFRTKLFASQVLVLAIIFFIASLLFIQQLYFVRIVVLFTLGLTSALGFSLVRSVKHEIEQREEIEKLVVQLKEANSNLKELDRQKDELLGIVSHQLATPISAVKWNLEMIIDGDLGKLTKEQGEHLKSMQLTAESLADLSRMILDVSRIQLGRMKVDRTELDIREFIEEVCNDIEPKSKEKKIKFTKSIPKSIPKAMLDKRLMRMTLENLLTNAVKYTPEGGEVELNVKIQKNNLYYEVKDTGCGIPRNEHDKIFGKLFRASNVRDTSGNGFGLFAAKGAVEAQGGTISFESTEGKGTTFAVTLPLVEQSSTDIKEKKKS